ncbi:MAG: hypothetical protein COV52_02130 [Gammaproteobacteria bacterium CG11_big_fil_rev_8_21_14_0_20_46_22]|nr:MAG: hypothetical protein COW05_04990 [Gammaproteobacteria bacterium CG12_big_fil_rev_8_21_14_0_65_46_12]PIR11788.1 MAG: hypothetical protein COV52_02130 [Gammaproteobacteria bacterium CG11_big_fil_rev_8_21_14_0_20_46_22]
MDIKQLHDYQQILDASSDLIYWKDSESNYLGCNRHILDATRIKKTQDILGKNDNELVWAQFSKLYREDELIRRAYSLGFDKVRPARLSPSLIREAFCLIDENH